MESYSHWCASSLTCASTGKRFAVEPTTRGEKVSLFPARSPLRRQHFSRNRTSEISLKLYFYSWLFS